jgi:signal transduction histidine kinase
LVASDEILQMFEAVLRLSEIEGGKRLESFPVLNLKELVGKVVEFYRPAIEDGGRKLQLGEIQPCAVNGDRGLLFQMLSNLLENSIIHTSKGTVITLALQSGRGHASIVLGDNGGGIPKPEREKVFQRFYRRDVSRNSPGHGLGLSLVAAIADAHGGTVAIHDPANGAPGVEFVIALPLLPAAASITAGQGRPTRDGWRSASAQPAE